VGFTKSLAGNLRVDGNVFRRDFHISRDDDTSARYGISFPDRLFDGDDFRVRKFRLAYHIGVDSSGFVKLTPIKPVLARDPSQAVCSRG